MAGDERARGRHADEHRPRPAADGRGGLLAERGVRLVADDDRVRVRDVARVADEPLVGLDRHGTVGAVLATQQRRCDALRVAAVAQLAEELVDEVAPVGEDQRAAGPRCLDEAQRGNRLAGPRRMLEPEALGGVRILGLLLELLLRDLGGLRLVVPVLRLLGLVVVVEVLLAGDAGGDQDRRLVERPGAVRLRVALRLGEERGERARQRVDLVGGEHRAVDQPRLVLRQQPVQPEQERPPLPPGDRRRGEARVELGQRGVERPPPRRPRRQRRGGLLALEHERLAREGRRTLDVVGGRNGRGLEGH